MILSGGMVYTYGGVSVTAGRGDIILQQKGDLYQLHGTEDSAEFIVISYLCDPEEIVAWLTEDGKVFHCTHAARYADAFERAAEVYSQSGICSKTLLRAMTQQLICNLIREKSAQTESPSMSPAAAAKAYMDEHSCDMLTVEEVAGAAGCSASHLRQLFKKAYGESPNKYLNRIRIERAKEMLSSGFFTQEEISAACGFRNVYYFGRVFKEHTGVSPGRY